MAWLIGISVTLVLWVLVLRRHKRILTRIQRMNESVMDAMAREITQLTQERENKDAAIRLLYTKIPPTERGVDALIGDLQLKRRDRFGIYRSN